VQRAAVDQGRAADGRALVVIIDGYRWLICVRKVGWSGLIDMSMNL